LEINNNKYSSFKGLKRVDLPEYPVVALREALVNAAVHRDYSINASTMVNIFTDRIEFTSIGGLARNLSLTDIMNGISHSRNNKLAHVLYRLELVEGFGTGIQRIIDTYKNFPVQPSFNSEPSSFLVILPNIHFSSDNEPVPEPEPIKETPKESVREVNNCMICNYTLRSRSDLICHFCIRNEDLLFRLVRNYVYDNPKCTMIEAALCTGVPTRIITKFLREERLEITDETADFLLCMKCKKPIKSGKLCDPCKKSVSDFTLQIKKETRNTSAISKNKFHTRKK
jgi:hypothetical protein